jgi:hypothetical protein
MYSRSSHPRLSEDLSKAESLDPSQLATSAITSIRSQLNTSAPSFTPHSQPATSAITSIPSQLVTLPSGFTLSRPAILPLVWPASDRPPSSVPAHSERPRNRRPRNRSSVLAALAGGQTVTERILGDEARTESVSFHVVPNDATGALEKAQENASLTTSICFSVIEAEEAALCGNVAKVLARPLLPHRPPVSMQVLLPRRPRNTLLG